MHIFALTLWAPFGRFEYHEPFKWIFFSYDKQLKKWRCHFVCLLACPSPYFYLKGKARKVQARKVQARKVQARNVQAGIVQAGIVQARNV